MKRFNVLPIDRERVVKYFAVAATGDPEATSPELSIIMEDGRNDELPMLQFAAFLREQFDSNNKQRVN